MAQKNKIILLTLLLVNSLVRANCTDSYPNVNLIIKTPPPTIIEEVSDEVITTEVGMKTLGKYSSIKDYSMETNLITTDNFFGVCGNVNKLKFTIKLESKILLSNLLDSKCQKDIVIKHENEHYNLTVKAINDSKEKINHLLNNLVNNNYKSSSIDGVIEKVKNKEAQTTKDISDYILSKIKEYNLPLDQDLKNKDEDFSCPN